MNERIKELGEQDRKVHYIDVGNMSTDEVSDYLEKIKEAFANRNEV